MHLFTERLNCLCVYTYPGTVLPNRVTRNNGTFPTRYGACEFPRTALSFSDRASTEKMHYCAKIKTGLVQQSPIPVNRGSLLLWTDCVLEGLNNVHKWHNKRFKSHYYLTRIYTIIDVHFIDTHYLVIQICFLHFFCHWNII